MKVPKKCNTINQIHSGVPLFTTSFSYESNVGPIHSCIGQKKNLFEKPISCYCIINLIGFNEDKKENNYST